MNALHIRPSAGRVREYKSYLLWAAPLVFLLLFYFYPLASIFQTSFARGFQSSTDSWWSALSSTVTWRVTWFTFWQAAVSTLLTLIIGLPGAYLMARYRFRGKSLLLALSSISFVMPTLVVAMAFNALLGSHGWLNNVLTGIFNLETPPIQFTNTLTAILVAHVYYNTTIVLRLVGDFWAHLDPRLNGAAQVLGATRWQSLRKITLPLLMPSITAAALLIFIFDFTSFGVILLLGGPRFATLEVEIYYQTVSLFNLPMAATLALIQLGFTVVLTILYTRMTYRISRPLTLRPVTYTQRSPATWQERLFTVLVAGGLLMFLVLPMLTLAARSVTRLENIREKPSMDMSSTPITLDFYRELGINRRQSIFYSPPTTAIAVSLGYAAITVVLALALGLPAAWSLAYDTGSSFNRSMDPVLMLPLGTSAVTLGLGFIVALDQPPLNLRASLLLVPLAHTLVALPIVVRSLTPALRSIRPRLRHSASVLGASPLQVFRYIELPLVGRAVIVAAIFAFTISLGEFGATAMIARPEYPTIPLAIYRFASQPGALNYGQALALSTILMIITTLGILAIERLRLAEIGEF